MEGVGPVIWECAARWGLSLGEPFDGSQVSLVLPAKGKTDQDLVLKVQFPHRESRAEAVALKAWGGRGAVRLLDYDERHHALLLERCLPGTQLSDVGAEAALDVLIDLLPRLWVPAPRSIGTLADEAEWWLGYLENAFERAGCPFDHELLTIATEALRELPSSQGEQVLIHQDLHGGNVLAANREPWLAIDPKALVGEREFSVAPIVRSYELGNERETVIHRFRRLTGELGLDPDRAGRWTIAQTLAWAFRDDGADPWHVQVATWLAHDV